MDSISLTCGTALLEEAPEQEIQHSIETDLFDGVPALTHYIYHDSFASPDAEEMYFGPELESLLSCSAMESVCEGNGVKSTALQEAIKEKLFLRYNYARYRLSLLLASQQDTTAAGMRQAGLWQRKALQARADLVHANMGLVLAMAKRVRIPALEFGELVSQGNLALLRSVESFDFSRGYKFSTYACRSILRSFSRLAAETGRQQQRFATRSDVDLDQTCPKSRDHDAQWEDAVDDINEILVWNLANLSVIEKTIILERFAINSQGKGKTLTEIGQIVGLTYERIRQINKQALAKMRVALEELRSGRASRLARQAG